MEVLSYSSGPCCHVLNLRLNFSQTNLPSSRRLTVPCARIDSVYCYLGLTKFLLNKVDRQQGFSLLGTQRNVGLKVFNGSYVADGTLEKEESETKVLIPSLGDEPNGEDGAQVSSCFWEWKPKFNVHYEKAGCGNVKSSALLFLPGFGVGSFHYEKQLKDLGRDYRVWALDFLGQGKSLPVEDPTLGSNSKQGENSMWGFGDEPAPWATELVYSSDLWRDQVQYFVEEIIGEPVYIVGNSLGGFVALYFAAYNPQLVKGITLLNATPFWGFMPNPIKSPRLATIFPWAGTFPLPSNVRKLTEILWQKISDPESIGQILSQVYVDHSTNVDKVFTSIVETTQHPAAAASLASIMCAPRGQLSFNEALSICGKSNVAICLVYGREDPWVRPWFGLDVKRQLPQAPYYELSPAGHCPHDEVPEVVNYLLRGWMKNLESQGSVALPLLDEPQSVGHIIAKELQFVRLGSRKSVSVKFFGSDFSLWKQMSFCLKSCIWEIKNHILNTQQGGLS